VRRIDQQQLERVPALAVDIGGTLARVAVIVDKRAHVSAGTALSTPKEHYDALVGSAGRASGAFRPAIETHEPIFDPGSRCMSMPDPVVDA
jgi:hypothetical protein